MNEQNELNKAAERKVIENAMAEAAAIGAETAVKVEEGTLALPSLLHDGCPMNERVECAAEAAGDAFWEVVRRAFPEATSGDFLTNDHDVMKRWIAEWLDLNVHEKGVDRDAPLDFFPPKGERVRFARSLCIVDDDGTCADFVVPEGATGVVALSDHLGFWIELDVHLPGCEEWKNQVRVANEDVGDWSYFLESERS
jgi:hypothetical protein